MTELATIDRSGWGSCSNCGQDLPDGGDICDGCSMPRRCTECHEVISAADGGLCEACLRYRRHEEGDQLAQRLSVAELVPVFQQADNDIRAGFALIARAERELNRAFTLDHTFGLRVHVKHNRALDFSKPEDPMRELRRSVWKTLVERLELRRMMSIKAWDDLEKQLDGDEVPEVTEESVAAMVEQFNSQLPAMLEAAVEEVFNWLRPPSSHYKTNTELEVGRRVCLSGVLDTYMLDLSGKLKISHYYQANFTALENVFTALDGQGSITKSHYSELSDAVSNAGFPCSGETRYFKFRGFKNRALHIEFTRLDLLEKFNRVAGGARLRPRT